MNDDYINEINLDKNLHESNFDLKLATVRAENPYIPIIKLPDAILNFVLTANIPQDVNIPSGSKLVRFVGSGDYYIQRNGNAQVPTATLTGDNSAMGALYKPEYAFFHAEEMKQISVIGPTTGTIVTVHCYFNQ